MPDFGNPFSGMNKDRPLNKEELIRAIRFVIAAEYEAVQLYTQLADSIQDNHVANVLRDIADEEIVHAGEFLAVLKELSPNEAKLYNEGEEEVKNMKLSRSEIINKARALKVINGYMHDVLVERSEVAMGRSGNATYSSDGNKIRIEARDWKAVINLDSTAIELLLKGVKLSIDRSIIRSKTGGTIFEFNDIYNGYIKIYNISPEDLRKPVEKAACKAEVFVSGSKERMRD